MHSPRRAQCSMLNSLSTACDLIYICHVWMRRNNVGNYKKREPPLWTVFYCSYYLLPLSDCDDVTAIGTIMMSSTEIIRPPINILIFHIFQNLSEFNNFDQIMCTIEVCFQQVLLNKVKLAATEHIRGILNGS